jgi:hypothetical protein
VLSSPPEHQSHTARDIARSPHSFPHTPPPLGFLELLSQLTSVGKVSREQFENRFDELRRTGQTYYIIVVVEVHSQEVVGSGTLLVESKFIHNCGKVCVTALSLNAFESCHGSSLLV